MMTDTKTRDKHRWKFRVSSTCVFVLCVLLITEKSQAYFGLSSAQPLEPDRLTSRIPTSIATFSTNQSTTNFATTSSSSRRELCDSFGLHPRQKQMCRKERGFASVLLETVHLSVSECQKQLQYERWNCSLDTTRVNILQRGFKETAFLYALSAASLVHVISRACSTGHLTQCTCDASLNDVENRRTWMWGGCGDNFQFGQKFARRFLQEKKRPHLDIRAHMDHHNSQIGIKVVRDMVQKVCKCHGVSGSCTMQTCWKQLSVFEKVGLKLKQKYNRAVEGRTRNEAHIGTSLDPTQRNRRSGKSRMTTRYKVSNINRNRKKKKKKKYVFGVKSKEMIYLERSPDFCNVGRYSWGTFGRECRKGSNCAEMCCGRGYNVHVESIQLACNCKVLWCCHVQCQTCNIKKEVHTCK